jgi:iron(III) transport system substrate-binding protein
MATRILSRTMAVAIGLAAASGFGTGTAEAAACAAPRQMEGFKTCADVAKAEQEGAVTFYTTDPEPGTAQVMAEFQKAFPKVKTAFIRLQAGNLYAKLSAERQARSNQADVMAISEYTFATDLQKKGGYLQYDAPELAAYRAAFKSKPEGFWTWGSLIIAGIAYNPKLVPPGEVPTNWDDAVNPRFNGQVNVKLSTSGLQHGLWYRLRQLYGEDFWTKFAEMKPRAFDSYVQQFDRLVNGQDKMVHGAQYSGYLQFRAKGAELGFVQPKDGMFAGQQIYGVIADAPHPEAAKLLFDWLMGIPGQTAIQNAHFLSSPRSDTPPPPGGMATGEMKLLFVEDWDDYLKSRPAFSRDWDRMLGLR